MSDPSPLDSELWAVARGYLTQLSDAPAPANLEADVSRFVLSRTKRRSVSGLLAAAAAVTAIAAVAALAFAFHVSPVVGGVRAVPSTRPSVGGASASGSLTPRSTAEPAAGPTLAATPGYGGPLRQSVTVLGTYQLDPPPSNVTPGVSWQSAVLACRTRGAVCVNNMPPHVTLALVTTTNGARINPDGSVTLTVDHKLMYVLNWSSIACSLPAGPAGAPGTARPTALPGKTCSFVALVDANTGAFSGAGGSGA